jgi:hypothetical protein
MKRTIPLFSFLLPFVFFRLSLQGQDSSQIDFGRATVAGAVLTGGVTTAHTYGKATIVILL